MEADLWYVLTGLPGGTNRVRIVHALAKQPRNAHQLAAALDLDDKTVYYHLELLLDKDILTSTDATYGRIYRPSDRAQTHWPIIERITETVDK
jgi:DNA-binding transcriptional ArsR family regulator